MRAGNRFRTSLMASVLLMLCVAAHAQEKGYWETQQDLLATTFKAGTPMLYSEDAMTHLQLAASCDGFGEAIKKCAPFDCVEKGTFSGNTEYYDKLIFGTNAGGQCVVDYATTRYFVPKNVLAVFAEVISSPVLGAANQSVTNGNTTTSTNQFTQIFGNVTCHVQVSTATTVDPSQKVLVTAKNKADYVNSPSLTTVNGKTYAYKTTVAKTVTVTPNDDAACDKAKFELIDKMQANGLAQEMTPVMVGFDSPKAVQAAENAEAPPITPSKWSASNIKSMIPGAASIKAMIPTK